MTMLRNFLVDYDKATKTIKVEPGDRETGAWCASANVEDVIRRILPSFILPIVEDPPMGTLPPAGTETPRSIAVRVEYELRRSFGSEIFRVRSRGDVESSAAKSPVKPPKTCTKCGHELGRDEHHDAYYCPVCSDWKEEPCGDANCAFCKDRPTSPGGEP